jgi:hypothetical protein
VNAAFSVIFAELGLIIEDARSRFNHLLSGIGRGRGATWSWGFFGRLVRDRARIS